MEPRVVGWGHGGAPQQLAARGCVRARLARFVALARCPCRRADGPWWRRAWVLGSACG